MRISTHDQLNKLKKEEYITVTKITLDLTDIINEEELDKILQCENVIVLMCMINDKMFLDYCNNFAKLQKLQHLTISNAKIKRFIFPSIIVKDNKMLITNATNITPSDLLAYKNITHINFLNCHRCNILTNLPDTIKYLQITNPYQYLNLTNLPYCLEELSINYSGNSDFNLEIFKQNIKLPYNCKLTMLQNIYQIDL
jgi:hypothetical protein